VECLKSLLLLSGITILGRSIIFPVFARSARTLFLEWIDAEREDKGRVSILRNGSPSYEFVVILLGDYAMTDNDEEMRDLLTTIRVACELTGQRAGQLLANVSATENLIFYKENEDFKLAIWEYVRNYLANGDCGN
jgi:hypothetical protein